MNHKEKGLRHILIQFCKFGLVGVVNNIISLAVYYVVIGIHYEWYLVGHVLGFLCSTLNAFLLNSRYVFVAASEKKKGAQLGKTYVVYTVSLCISTALLYVLVQKMQVSQVIAPICALMITVPFNFLMNRFWIYQRKP